MMTDAQVCGIAVEMLDERHFYAASHARVFKAVKELYIKKGIVELTVLRAGVGETTWRAVKNVIQQATGSGAYIEHYAKTILELYEKRVLVEAAQSFIYAVTGESKISLEEARKGAAKIAEKIGVGSEETEQPLEGQLEDVLDKVKNHHREGFVSTGLPRLDWLLDGGMGPGWLVVLGARRSVGKTAVASALALEALRKGKHVAWLSCEMGYEEMLSRWLVALSGVPLSHRRAPLSDDEQATLDEATVFLAATRPVIWDTSMGVEALKAACLRMKTQGQLDLLVVDYLQIMKHPKANSEHERLTQSVVALKSLARDLKIPVLLVAQCRRESDPNANRRVIHMAHLKGTGGIEENADVVILLWPGSADERNVIHGDLAKNRHGPAGRFALYADFGRMSIGEWREA